MNIPSPIRALAAGARDELLRWSWRQPRNLAALKPVASVAIAVAASHALGLPDSWWAAISAFSVMQASWGATLYRGVLRVLGTVGGAFLGWQLGLLLAGHPALFVAVMALAAWAGLYAALALRHGYAWVLALVTFAMVLCEAFVADAGGLAGFARERVASVALGTAACVFVSLLGAWARPAGPRPWQAEPMAAALRPKAAHHALQGALAVAALAIVLLFAEWRPFAQAMVTTIAVLVVPLEGLASDPRGSVAQRMVQRLAGCLLAIGLAAALLPWIEGHPLGCQVALAAGVWCAAYLQGGTSAVRYAAVQFGVGFIMVFVQDHGWRVDEAPVLQRMGGMLAGIAVLWPVMALGAARSGDAGRP